LTRGRLSENLVISMGRDAEETEFKGIFLEKYEKLRRQRIKEKKGEFEKEKLRNRARIEQEIERDQRHRDLVNMCISPFIIQGRIVQLGYRFVRAEPLAELGVKNFDFLIYNQKNRVAIFGEAKGSISDSHDVVSETSERIHAVGEHVEYISEAYLGEVPSRTEFVLGVYAMDDEKVIREISRQGGGIIVWSIDRYNSTLTPKTLLDNENEAIRQGTLHGDARLINAIKNVQTSHKLFEIFPSSHIFSLLRVLLLAKTKDDQGNLFLDKKDLAEIIKKELFYLNESLQDKKVEATVNTAVSIGFLRPVDSGLFKIVSRYRADKSLEKDLKKKYVKYLERRQLRQAIQEAVSETRKEVKD
jgi:hypothetical protein